MIKIFAVLLLSITLLGCSKQKEKSIGTGEDNSINIAKDTTIKTSKETSTKIWKDTLIKTEKHYKPIKLERIIFHTSRCFGPCPAYHLQIDSDKKIKLFAQVVFKVSENKDRKLDSTKIGYYSGTISDTTFKNLITLLQICDIDNLTFDGPDCCDSPIRTIIVYYNGKRKYLSAMFPPEKAVDLIHYLNNICEYSKLQVSDKFNIEE